MLKKKEKQVIQQKRVVILQSTMLIFIFQIFLCSMLAI